MKKSKKQAITGIFYNNLELAGEKCKENQAIVKILGGYSVVNKKTLENCNDKTRNNKSKTIQGKKG